MTTTAYQAARAEAVRILSARIERIAETPATTGRVIRVGHHLYLHPDGYLVGVEVAEVYTSASMAQHIASRTMNGYGERGHVVQHEDALQAELEHLTSMLGHIEGAAA